VPFATERHGTPVINAARLHPGLTTANGKVNTISIKYWLATKEANPVSEGKLMLGLGSLVGVQGVLAAEAGSLAQSATQFSAALDALEEITTVV
jgi:hypothetical protein